MSQTDPVADFLTKLRNANASGHDSVEVKASKLKIEVARILQEEGFVTNYEVRTEKSYRVLKVDLKYGERKKPVLEGIRRVSRPGMRSYSRADRMPSVRSGLGITIVSTSKGVLTHKQAILAGVGGELICSVW